jgi:hypothetical protein
LLSRIDWRVAVRIAQALYHAIKEAVAVGYPREKMYDVWWLGAEQHVRPAEAGAIGYCSTRFKLHEDLKKYVYDQGQGNGRTHARSSTCAD